MKHNNVYCRYDTKTQMVQRLHAYIIDIIKGNNTSLKKKTKKNLGKVMHTGTHA